MEKFSYNYGHLITLNHSDQKQGSSERSNSSAPHLCLTDVMSGCIFLSEVRVQLNWFAIKILWNFAREINTSLARLSAMTSQSRI